MTTPRAALIAVAPLFAALAVAPAAQAADIEIKNAVARVVVIPEDRSDVGVEIIQGSSGLPALEMRRRGADVQIRGGVRGRDLRDCNGESAGARQPGEGASVEVRRVGRVSLSDAPMIVLRTPRSVDVSVDGAVFGSVGRGATSVDLGNGGCGAWTVANVAGDLSLSAAGSGPMRAGTSQSLELSVAGSGNVVAGATGSADVSVAGSGDVQLVAATGDLDVSIAGSGDVLVRGGASRSLEVSIAGSGGVDHRGEVGDVEVSIVGSGDVRVARATGAVSRSIIGSGDVTVGP